MYKNILKYFASSKHNWGITYRTYAKFNLTKNILIWACKKYNVGLLSGMDHAGIATKYTL